MVDWANYIIDEFAKTKIRLAKKPKTDTYPAITFETTIKVIINKLVEADKQMKTNMISLHRAYNLTEFGMNEDLYHMLHGLYPFTQPGTIHPDWVYIHALILYKSACFDASQLKQFDSYLHEIRMLMTFLKYKRNLNIEIHWGSITDDRSCSINVPLENFSSRPMSKNTFSRLISALNVYMPRLWFVVHDHILNCAGYVPPPSEDPS